MKFWTTNVKNKETLKERVRRHIKDINSTISDEDIRNVEIEFELMTDRDLNIKNKNDKRKRRRDK